MKRIAPALLLFATHAAQAYPAGMIHPMGWMPMSMMMPMMHPMTMPMLGAGSVMQPFTQTLPNMTSFAHINRMSNPYLGGPLASNPYLNPGPTRPAVPASATSFGLVPARPAAPSAAASAPTFALPRATTQFPFSALPVGAPQATVSAQASAPRARVATQPDAPAAAQTLDPARWQLHSAPR